MLRNPDYVTARRLLLDAVEPVGREFCALERCGGRLLGRNLTAAENIPPFDRSPYDGYALRAADTAGTGSGWRDGGDTHCSTPVSRSTEVPATGVVNSCTGTSRRTSTTAHRA